MNALLDNSTPSGKALSEFLKKYVTSIPDFSNVPLPETGLLDGMEEHPFNMTHFDDMYDTLLYSRLISRAIELFPQLQTIIDLGAGSSIPTLIALNNLKDQRPRVIAVDIDPKALAISKQNAEAVGLADHYSFKLGSMQTLLDSEIFKSPGNLIVSNPPYIPTPQGVEDYHLIPVDGGEDGTRYVQDILQCEYPRDTMLALFWGSLCNPSLVIPIMEERFEILHVHAVKVHFGNYTTLPVINTHLHELRAKGLIVFEDAPGRENQIVIGTILKPRRTS
ncbi:methyltransferase domain-containing protein [Segetibacter sp. 3557_3]|uniref:methyltransferase n=1 Tax=Segetibacter sp. 3557_3 TaxID=2547429 RepID=UPI00105875C9|nr:methyltransferase [Segetibacter sp. 3557_3]TDH26772.1 methyltransferase domain-containing protein [Segetibacter sp. 3557_3]